MYLLLLLIRNQLHVDHVLERRRNPSCPARHLYSCTADANLTGLHFQIVRPTSKQIHSAHIFEASIAPYKRGKLMLCYCAPAFPYSFLYENLPHCCRRLENKAMVTKTVGTPWKNNTHRWGNTKFGRNLSLTLFSARCTEIFSQTLICGNKRCERRCSKSIYLPYPH